MTEEQIRAIVRDEIEAECLKPGGLYDEARKTAFGMARVMMCQQAQSTLALFPDNDRNAH